MSHSFTKINVHIIFHIKSTGCVIQEEHLSRLFHYIGGTIRAMSGHVYMVGGMPDHIHILVVKDSVSQETLGQFVAAFKSIVSNRWLSACKSKGIEMGKLWQRGYYDHVLRNEADYVEKAAYMEANAERWIEKGDRKGRPYARIPGSAA